MSAGTGLPGMAPQRARERRSRCLFHWRAADGVLAALTGQTPTFARASVGSEVPDQQGRIVAPVHSQPSWTTVDADGDGVRDELGLLLDRGSTNLALQSENFGTTWAAIGTPTRTAAARVLGAVSLDLLGDDAAGTLEGYSQVITYTGNAVKSLFFYWGVGTSASSVVRLRDTTASANRLLLAITSSGGVPSVAMTTGTLVGSPVLIGTVDGVAIYRIEVQATSVTAANTNQLEFYPATDAALSVAATGNCYFSAVQPENAFYASGYVKTTTGTVTRTRDALTYAIGFLPQDLTLYARVARPNWAALSGDLVFAPGILSIGSGSNRLELYFSNSTRVLGINAVDNAGAGGAATAAIPAGAVIEVCAQLFSAKLANQVRIDVGAGFGAFSSANGPFGAAWGAAILGLGDLIQSVGNCLGTPLSTAKVAAGALTLEQMRQIR